MVFSCSGGRRLSSPHEQESSRTAHNTPNKNGRHSGSEEGEEDEQVLFVPAHVDAVEALQVFPQDQEDVLLLLQVRSRALSPQRSPRQRAHATPHATRVSVARSNKIRNN
jgi:hypothetical protein